MLLGMWFEDVSLLAEGPPGGPAELLIPLPGVAAITSS